MLDGKGQCHSKHKLPNRTNRMVSRSLQNFLARTDHQVNTWYYIEVYN